VVDQLEAETRPSPPAPRIPPSRWGLALASAGCTGAVLISHKSAPPAVVVTLILLAAAASIELARREARRPGDVRPIAWTIAGLYLLAVTRPPRFATDIWSYTLVGRIVTAHHLNPYQTAPIELAHDPMLHYLHHTWSTGTTPYGPLFVLHSAFIALVSGTHPTLYRFLFQLVSAVAVAIALVLLWRTTRSTAAVALVGLNPVVAGSIVNGGHNDALLALGLLGSVLLLQHDRALVAGWVLCATVLVKITIGFAVLPLVLWTATRSGKRDVVRLLAPTACVALPVFLLVPGALHSMTSANSGVVTRLSVWNIPQRVTWFGLTNNPGVNFTTAGTIAAVLLAVFAAVLCRRQPDAGRGAATATAGWLVAAGYVLAWYTVMGLVVAALRPTDRITRWLAVQGGLITAAFLVPREDLSEMPVVGRVVLFWVPLALTIGFVWALVPLVRDARRLRRAPAATSDRTSPTATV